MRQKRLRACLPGAGRLAAALLLAVAAGAQSNPPPATGRAPEPAGGTAMKITIQSTAFEPGQPIPKKYSGEGQDVSPPLKWSGVPKEAQELVLICDDPDAPRPEPWVHWVIYGMAPTTTELPEGIAKQPRIKEPVAAAQGANSWNKPGYGGPMPPPGHGVHHYHFKLYALDTALKLEPGQTKDDLLKRMKGHILAEGELIGTYKR